MPRTGSSSMERALKHFHQTKYEKIAKSEYRKLIKTHITAQAFKKDNPSIWKGKPRFAFVRNPFDRIVSYYLFYKSKKWYTKGFKRFVTTYLVEGKHISKVDREIDPAIAPHWFLQYRWLSNNSEGKKLIVNHIGRFENLREDLEKICGNIAIDTPVLPWLNKSKKRKNYRDYYDDETEQVVIDKCKKDFELFNYEPRLEAGPEYTRKQNKVLNKEEERKIYKKAKQTVKMLEEKQKRERKKEKERERARQTIKKIQRAKKKQREKERKRKNPNPQKITPYSAPTRTQAVVNPKNRLSKPKKRHVLKKGKGSINILNLKNRVKR